MPESTEPKCLVCNRNGNEVPLIQLQYQNAPYWICPQDFPVLIHQPDQLIGRLPGAEKLSGHEH
jgi:hypothetical protein